MKGSNFRFVGFWLVWVGWYGVGVGWWRCGAFLGVVRWVVGVRLVWVVVVRWRRGALVRSLGGFGV